MKKTGSILLIIFGIIIALGLFFLAVYTCVPGVKTYVDERVFPKQEETTETETEETETNMSINFDTHTLTLEV